MSYDLIFGFKYPNKNLINGSFSESYFIPLHISHTAKPLILETIPFPSHFQQIIFGPTKFSKLLIDY
jgi:hypothetical protein